MQNEHRPCGEVRRSLQLTRRDGTFEGKVWVLQTAGEVCAGADEFDIVTTQQYIIHTEG